MRCGRVRLAKVLCATTLVVALSLVRRSYIEAKLVPRNARRSSVGGSGSSVGGGDHGSSRPTQEPNARDTELEAWHSLLSRCGARQIKSPAVELLRKGEVPVVIMAGSRSEYLQQQLESLDALGHAQLVIVSFNRPVLKNSRSAKLTKSFEAASLMRHLVIWPIWVRD